MPPDGGQACDLEPDRMYASRARAAAWDVQLTGKYDLPCYGPCVTIVNRVLLSYESYEQSIEL